MNKDFIGDDKQSVKARVGILGGSSAFVPALAQALAEAAADLPDLEICLQGRDEKKLRTITRFCNRLARKALVPHEYQYAFSTAEAARGARVVINQMRVGSFAGRCHDDQFPHRFDLPGDETIGPGGLASAIRGMPVVLEAAREVAKISPGAWFINMSNPMGILLGGLRTIPGIRSFGLCELPPLTMERVADFLEIQRGTLESDFLGLNHQGWFVRLSQKKTDLLPRLCDKIDRTGESGLFPISTRKMRELHALPLSYMRLYYHTAREVAFQKGLERSRGESLIRLSGRLFEWYEQTEQAELPTLIKERGLQWYPLALVPSLVALLSGKERALYLSEINGTDIPGLPADAIVEKHCTLGPSGSRWQPFKGPQPVTGGDLEPFLEFLRKLIAYEQAACRAAASPCPDSVIEALEIHPLGISSRKAQALAEWVLQSVEA